MGSRGRAHTFMAETDPTRAPEEAPRLREGTRETLAYLDWNDRWSQALHQWFPNCHACSEQGWLVWHPATHGIRKQSSGALRVDADRDVEWNTTKKLWQLLHREFATSDVWGGDCRRGAITSSDSQERCRRDRRRFRDHHSCFHYLSASRKVQNGVSGQLRSHYAEYPREICSASNDVSKCVLCVCSNIFYNNIVPCLYFQIKLKCFLFI